MYKMKGMNTPKFIKLHKKSTQKDNLILIISFFFSIMNYYFIYLILNVIIFIFLNI